MWHVVIASHHQLAEGLRDTVEFVIVPRDIEVICAFMDETPVEDQVAKVFSKFGSEDDVLVLTDILAGSVNQALAPHMSGHVLMVAGVNLPLALELCASLDAITPDMVREAIAEARNQVVFVNDVVLADDEDDE